MMAYEYIKKIEEANTPKEVYKVFLAANKDISVSSLDMITITRIAHDRSSALNKRKV